MIIPVDVLFEVYRKAYSQQFGTTQRTMLKDCFIEGPQRLRRKQIRFCLWPQGLSELEAL